MSTRHHHKSSSNNNKAGDKQHQLEDDFASFSARFNSLANDCRLSFLEIKLYRKYFVETEPKTPEKLSRLKMICSTLEKHRQNTINVLKTIHEREQIMDAINSQIDKISSSANRNASILDFQSDGLHLIYLHQQVTLRVVEAVENWRRPLTRPFPFIHQGENYFAKILADTSDVSASSLGKILPVKLNQYPLCSDLPSLCLFSTPNPAAAVSKGGKQPPTRMTSEMASKINSAQSILLEELEIQKRLLRELEGLSTAGFFLPVINLHSLIPACSSGIRMSNHEWEEQLREAIAEAKDDLEAAEDRTHHPRSSPASRNPAGGSGGGSGASPSRRNAPPTSSSAYADDFADDSSSSSSSSPSSSSSSSSRVSSPTPENSPSKKPLPAVPQDQKLPSRPSSAKGTAPQPPPRPTSAMKRSASANNETPPVAPAQPKQEEQTGKKEAGSDDDFEKEDSDDE